jgi:hypothetical protein
MLLGAMFLKTYTELPVDFERVSALLLGRPEHWLHSLPEEMEREGARLLVAAGAEIVGHRVHAPFWLEVGVPLAGERVLSVPFRLPGNEGLFPALVGSVDAAWLGAGRTHLALAAQYSRSSGVLAAPVEPALLHRVAETAAQRFMDREASRLTAEGAGA